MLKYTVPSIDARRAYIDHDTRHIIRWAHEIHAHTTRTQAQACEEAAATLEASINALMAAQHTATAHAESILKRVGQIPPQERAQFNHAKPPALTRFLFERVARIADFMRFSIVEQGGGVRLLLDAKTARFYDITDGATTPEAAQALEAHDAERKSAQEITRAGRPDNFLIMRNGGTLDAALKIIEAWREYSAASARAQLIAADKTRLIDAKRDLKALAARARGLNLSYGDDIPLSAHDATQAERGILTRNARAYLYFYLIALKKVKRYAAKRASRTYSDAPETLDIFEQATDAARCSGASKRGGQLCFMCAHAQEQRIRARIESAARDHLKTAIFESARARAEALRAQIIARWL